MEYQRGTPIKFSQSFRCIIVPLLLFIFWSTVPFSLQAAEPALLPEEVKTIIESSRYRYARWGLCVLDMNSGDPLYAHNADTLVGPASVAKLFTTAAALDQLGRDYTTRTVLYRQGKMDRMRRLHGDLILVAHGDISLSGLRSLADRVKAAGVGTVMGDIVIDDRLFVAYRAYSVARPGKLLYIVSPVLLQDNLVEITIRPVRSDRASITWRPQTPWLQVASRVRSVSGSEPENIRIAEDRAGRIFISGQIPDGSPAVAKHVPVSDPASLLRSLFIEALKKAGVRVHASPRRSNPAVRLPAPGAYDRLVKVAEQVSPPLAHYVQSILKTSHNQGADLLPLLMAAQSGQKTFAEGMKRERNFLARAGIDLGALSLGDGSGISPANLATPRAVVQFLKFMTTHRDFALFRDALPVLGVDGTLARAGGEAHPARGKILAKTGTIGLFDLLNDSGFVQYKSLAGYMTTASGRFLAFAVFVNHVHVIDAQDRKAVLKLTSDVGADLVRIAEHIYLRH